MAKKGENIYKRKDGRWEGRYIKGRSQQNKSYYGYVYAKTYNEVKKKLIIKKNESMKCETVVQKASEITFQEIAMEWLRSLSGIKPSTYNKYFNTLKSYVFPILGKYNVMAIQQETFDYMIATLQSTCSLKSKRPLSPKTIKEILSILKRISTYATIKGICPVYKTDIYTIKNEHKELIIFDKNQEEIFFTYLTEHMEDKNLGIIICLLTGLRIGEICALKWEDISIPDATIRVSKTMQRVQLPSNVNGVKTEVMISVPKTACSNRTIPLPDILLNILRDNQKDPEMYVLSGDTKNYIEPRALQYHYKKVLKKSNIEYRNYHTLRHTFATRCVEAGFDIKSLSEILGHSSVTITMNRYVHPSIDLKRQNMNKLNELFAVK